MSDVYVTAARYGEREKVIEWERKWERGGEWRKKSTSRSASGRGATVARKTAKIKRNKPSTLYIGIVWYNIPRCSLFFFTFYILFPASYPHRVPARYLSYLSLSVPAHEHGVTFFNSLSVDRARTLELFRYRKNSEEQ